MIQERYCSYEVSKLLEEKGFDGDGGDCECHMFYCEYSEERIMPICEIAFVPDNEKVFFAPTHQMAIDWIREKHGIFIEIFSSIDLNGNYHYSYNVLGSDCKYIRKGYTSFDWEYKDTVEAALEFCLTKII